jgi:hypothetical protein
MGGLRNIYKILVGKPGGKRSRGRPRGRWKYHMSLNVREIA